MKILRLITILALLVIALVLIEVSKKTPPVQEKNVLINGETESQVDIRGCYVARQQKDVYTLNIESIEGENVTGKLTYDNYQKDSSSGTITGTFDGNMLIGIYDFRSEGMDSIRDVAFKKTADGFIQGFGEVEAEGNRERLVSTDNLNYENSPEYIAESCTAE